MATSPVNGWNSTLLIAAESTFGTTAVPADVSSYAATAVEHISADLGQVEQGAVRPKADHNQGRGNTNAFVEGQWLPSLGRQPLREITQRCGRNPAEERRCTRWRA